MLKVQSLFAIIEQYTNLSVTVDPDYPIRIEGIQI
jgi:hypothetical protein